MYFVGVLQIVAGLLSVLFSLFGVLQSNSAGVEGLLNPQEVAHLFSGHESGEWINFVSGFVSLHLAYGWVLGLVLITAGICCIRRRARWFVWFSTVLNLVNFPHGTTVGLMTLHGLSRSRISGAFAGKGK